MTPSPVLLKEALAWYDGLPPRDLVTEAPEVAVILDAARWALDLIEGGKEVWWCETRQQSTVPPLVRKGCGEWSDKCGKRLLVTP